MSQDAAPAADLAGKRVVFVLAGEILGGAERNALALATHFARVEGADVQIVALDDTPGRSRAIAESEGIRWSCVRTPWVGGKLVKIASLLEVTRALRRLHPDVLVPRTNLPNVVCGLTWRLTGAKLCVWNQLDVLGTTRFSRRLFQRALQASPLAVTTAYHVREWLVEVWGADPFRVHVIRSEVSLPPAAESRESWRDRLGIQESDFVACMLGHLHRGKDHATLLRAWRLVADRLQLEERRALLLVAGRPAGTEDDVKALAFDLDLGRQVRFLGDVADVSGLLGAVDLAVFSSHSEAFGRGATEPMFVGLAVVATDVPGIREAVGEPGREFLARPGDAASLAAEILRLAVDAGLRERIGRANAELMRERQSEEPTSRAYAQLIASGLAGAVPAADFRESPSPSSA